MKIVLELYGASRDLSNKNNIEFDIKKEISIKDFRKILIKFIDEKFQSNKNYKKMINSSVFCSEKNEIISDNYKISKEQKISIIPPIGGG